MLISLCTPCMNRMDDLLATLSHKVAAANACPPVEIVTVDYNSTDGLEDSMRYLMKKMWLAPGNFFTYRKYTGRTTYHAAHANNLAMLTGGGEYVVLVPADFYIDAGFISVLRERIAQGCVWCNTAKKHRSAIAIRKDEFIAAGGYDERFEMYGPDDIDLIERLHRRGLKHGVIPDEYVRSIYTAPAKKVANYRIKDKSHQELGRIYGAHLYDNRSAQTLVGNAGLDWGKFDG